MKEAIAYWYNCRISGRQCGLERNSVLADSDDGVTFSSREGIAAPQLVVELVP